MSAKTSKMSFSVIIPAHNNPGQLRHLLDSLRTHAVSDEELEVIVVDDCSRDDDVKKAAQAYPFVRYLKLNVNQGPAAARNAGARMARNETLLFLDSDVILNTDTLPRIRACFENDPSLVAVCGEYDLKPANPSFSTDFKAVLSRSWAPPGGVITVFVARIGAIKKRVFEEMDGFDVSIKTASSEEWEFARRLNDKGYTIRYDPAITARHHFPPFGKLVGLFFHRAFMWIYVFKKHGGFDNTCTTPWQAMAQATGFFTTLFLAIAAVHQVFLYASFLSLLAFVLLNLKFFAIAAKAKGYLFALASLPLMLILASATFLGGMWGLFYYYVLHTGSDSANASFGT